MALGLKYVDWYVRGTAFGIYLWDYVYNVLVGCVRGTYLWDWVWSMLVRPFESVGETVWQCDYVTVRFGGVCGIVFGI